VVLQSCGIDETIELLNEARIGTQFEEGYILWRALARTAGKFGVRSSTLQTAKAGTTVQITAKSAGVPGHVDRAACGGTSLPTGR